MMAAANNAARFAGGYEINRRWVDVIDPKPEETRTAGQVIAGLRAQMRLDFGEKRGDLS